MLISPGFTAFILYIFMNINSLKKKKGGGDLFGAVLLRARLHVFLRASV